MKNINLRKELQEAETKITQAGLFNQVMDWLESDVIQEDRIKDLLRAEASHTVTISPELVDKQSAFSIAAIKKTAVKFRLRFLDSHFYTGEIPAEAIAKIRRLESESGTALSRFYILAPAKKFKLGDCNEDPLLFVPLNDGRYYLVHKWGNDLKWYRSLLKFPMRNWQTMVFTLLLMNTAITLLMPSALFITGEETSYMNSGRVIFFFWINLLTAAIFSYVGFAFNFTFSRHNWNSKYFND